MAVDDRYKNARATRQEESRDRGYGGYISKRNKKKVFNKVKKSALLIIIAATLVIGIVGGFFLNKYTSKFELLSYKVNGTTSEEIDYVVVDVSEIRENLEAAEGSQNVTMEEIYAAVNLEDGGVNAKFLGVDISDSVTKTYYYREDISHEATEVNKIEVSTPGVYYIVYECSHFAFKKTILIRTIVITGVEIDG